jgi:hypothetical protein
MLSLWLLLRDALDKDLKCKETDSYFLNHFVLLYLNAFFFLKGTFLLYNYPKTKNGNSSHKLNTVVKYYFWDNPQIIQVWNTIFWGSPQII